MYAVNNSINLCELAAPVLVYLKPNEIEIPPDLVPML